MITISMKREALLARLDQQLILAKAEDKRIAASHEKDKKASLAKFRLELRKALTWDYETAKKSRYYDLQIDAPSCPLRQEKIILSAINMVKWDTRKVPFRITEGSDLHRAISWIPESQKKPTTVCD